MFVLLLGEIDLSVGYVSGMGGVVAAVLLEPGKGVPTSVAIILALGAGAVIGLMQGFFVAKLGVPSFVVTLAGLLGWNGVVLQVIGCSGTIVIQNNVRQLDRQQLRPRVAGLGGGDRRRSRPSSSSSSPRCRRRAQAGLPNQPWLLIGARIVLLGCRRGRRRRCGPTRIAGCRT